MSERRKQIEATVIRGVILTLGGLAVISTVVGFLPATEVYREGALERTRTSGGGAYAAFCIAAALPSLLVWRRPRPLHLFAWSAYLWILGFVVLASTFTLDFDWGDYTYVELWPKHVFDCTAVPLALAAYVVIPVLAFGYWLVTGIIDVRRRQPPPPPQLPTARLIER